MGYDYTNEKEKEFSYDKTSFMPSFTIQSNVFGRDRLPNKSPKVSDYNEWKHAYINHLMNMYLIIENNYDEDRFEFFCKMVYSKSSKYISTYL